MNDPIPSPPPRSVSLRRAAFAVVALLGIAIAWALWISPRGAGGFGAKTSGSSLRVRDVYADSPFQNAAPGGRVCRRHGLHRMPPRDRPCLPGAPDGSIARAGRRRGEGPPTTAATGLPFELNGLQYTIERRKGRTFHKATRRDAAGGVLSETEAEVRFALGSGTRGTTFLIERDGFLFQSPIAWFAQKGRWDISPGFGEVNPHANFERHRARMPVLPHQPIAPRGRDVEPLRAADFRGPRHRVRALSRPGALHVKRGGLSTGPDLTIVNPANLAPALRDSVCQQCHLQGWFRIPRAGRDFFDFRPGLPLHRFLAVFVQKSGNQGKFEVAGQVEQMESSRCFRASQGQLGCISCHDPHRLPAPSIKAAYYRDRCLECHEKKGCALPLAERQARGRGGDCIACHMPRSRITNIAHLAETDHRIHRGSPGSGPVRGGPAGRDRDAGRVRSAGVSLGADDRGGTAGGRARPRRGPGNGGPPLARTPNWRNSRRARRFPCSRRPSATIPTTCPPANHSATSWGSWAVPRTRSAHFERILRIQPGREWTLSYSALALKGLQRFDLARAALQKTIAVNPWRSDYRLGLARVCSQAGDWAGAVAACREAIRLNPDLVEARSLLVQCYLQSREPDKADAELQDLLRFYPASREAWQQWYKQQKQAGRRGVSSASSGEP